MSTLIIEAGRTERQYWRDLWRDLVRYEQTVVGFPEIGNSESFHDQAVFPETGRTITR